MGPLWRISIVLHVYVSKALVPVEECDFPAAPAYTGALKRKTNSGYLVHIAIFVPSPSTFKQFLSLLRRLSVGKLGSIYLLKWKSMTFALSTMFHKETRT